MHSVKIADTAEQRTGQQLARRLVLSCLLTAGLLVLLLVASAGQAGAAVLEFVEARVDGEGDVDALSGATSVTLSPDGAHVYVAADVDGALTVFSWDGGTGRLTLVEVIDEL